MEYNNILLIKMSSLGDILHSLPFAAALRSRYPHAKITWMVHPQFAGFLPDPPVIDEVLYFDKVKFNSIGFGEKIAYFKELRDMLRSKNFDLVIDLQGLFKSAVIAAMCGCENRIGYCEMREGSKFVSKAIKGEHSKDHVIERYLDVARYLGAEVKEIEFPMPDLTAESQSIANKLAANGVYDNSYVVIVPGARWETKVWPADHYADLAKMIIEDGRSVVLAGGAEDKVKGLAISAKVNSDKLVNLIGETSLKELAALIKGCSVYISADTGPLHFAAALKKPLIALYGPTSPERTGPYGSNDTTVITSPAACAGCLKKVCDNWHCMDDITPEMVYNAYKQKVKE